jgi:chromosome segregation protein
MASVPKGALLLKLRKIELLGFKSFCERTVVTFGGSGITCIVGPNGCGKSNIVDAISWVLGEQSHKALRAERMADCIFNGTAKRSPLGMSEVLLTLMDPDLAEAAQKVLEAQEVPPDAAPAADLEEGDLNTEATENTEVAEKTAAGTEEAQDSADQAKQKRRAKPVPATRPGEVVVGRRLYRSGQSEYLINGRVARLRDVQDIFLGTGLGPESYAIIEQGRIGQILGAKPLDRRAIIDEAAGITKYKMKKRLAEAKLEGAKINLARVNDIFVEVEKQLASLKRQAAKARRYTELREQMRGRQRLVLASRAQSLEAEATRLESTLAGVLAAEQEQALQLAALESEHGGLAARTAEIEAGLRQVTTHLSECSLELDRAENRLTYNREHGQEMAGRLEQVAREAVDAVAQLARAEESATSHRQALAALREEKESLETALREATEAAARQAMEERKIASQIELLRQAAADLGHEQVSWRAEEARAEQSLEQYDATLARLRDQGGRLGEEEQGARTHLEAAAAQAGAATARAARLSGEVCQRQEEATLLRNCQQEAVRESERLREELTHVRAEANSLERILNERSYSAEAVQRLFAANGHGEERGFRAVGVLADYAEVAEPHEAAIEQFLRDELEYVVVEDFDHARAGISLLRDEVGGRATFFVDSVRNLPQPARPETLPFSPGDGVVARFDELVDFRDPLGPAAKHFLPKLASAYLVETAESAERLAHGNPGHHFVTPEGTCYHGRLVTGGRPGEAGPLQTKRELRQLHVRATEGEESAGRTKERVEELAAALERVEQALSDVKTAHVEAEKTALGASLERNQAETELARSERLASECRIELTRIEREAGESRVRASAARRMLERAVAAASATETERKEAVARLESLRQEQQAGQECVGERRAAAAQMAERLAAAETEAARLEAEAGEEGVRAAALEEQRRGLEAERASLEAASAELERRREALAGEKARLAIRLEDLEQEFEAARARLAELDDLERQRRQTLADLREERSACEVARARNESDRGHLREICVNDMGLQPEELMALEPEKITGETLEAAEGELREIRARIEAMGAVNMMALEEYQQCEERHTFLDRERTDLLASIADTQQVIKELDQVSRERFEQAFEVINRNFAVSFQTLFGGGTGQMRLTEPDSSGESGVEIVAQPPGKRLQNVMLLSGGEKALTALALLIAVFRFQPSPFCILDEVDAPLDDANVGRFTRLVAEMGAQTQFLIVTHNRRTMEMAEVLYGVTMQEPGVSKLVSVRWGAESSPKPAKEPPRAQAASAAA